MDDVIKRGLLDMVYQERQCSRPGAPKPAAINAMIPPVFAKSSKRFPGQCSNPSCTIHPQLLAMLESSGVAITDIEGAVFCCAACAEEWMDMVDAS